MTPISIPLSLHTIGISHARCCHAIVVIFGVWFPVPLASFIHSLRRSNTIYGNTKEVVSNLCYCYSVAVAHSLKYILYNVLFS